MANSKTVHVAKKNGKDDVQFQKISKLTHRRARMDREPFKAQNGRFHANKTALMRMKNVFSRYPASNFCCAFAHGQELRQAICGLIYDFKTKKQTWRSTQMFWVSSKMLAQDRKAR